ncbi:MAG TPA: Ppx/GppA phosphatase family protein [Candidatus Acidoferrales bacterium]|nr:Ppx/GppA phosphatase family protein [Candidatus Acidoferrales bacterium]
MALAWGHPARIAAIDAGSNAIRLAIAEARSAVDLRILETERYAVRLGHRVFVDRRLGRATIAQAAQAFRHFRRLLDRYEVKQYRAVATSAAREARNRNALIERARRETGLRLEVIHPAEEARLVRQAVVGILGESLAPRLIFDMGGGSLELTLLRGRAVERSVALPLGAVRLMETTGLRGSITAEQYAALQLYILSVLEAGWPNPPDLSGAVVAACGGNAEALARLTPGPPVRGIGVLSLPLLRRRFWELLRLDVRGRMRAFRVREDRADVMGVAAVVLITLGEWLRLRYLLVPGVGVREGVLRELAQAMFQSRASRTDSRRAARLLENARRFAAHFRCDLRHCENTRRLAAGLFDQLAPVHGLPGELCLSLELAAVLHDVGLAVNSAGHQKHGEYLVRHGAIPGLTGQERDLVACLVRYHAKAEPQLHHKLYSSFDPRERRQIRILAALLRIAIPLDGGSENRMGPVEVAIDADRVNFYVPGGEAAERALRIARQRAALFEREFALKTRFRRVTAAERLPIPGEGNRTAEAADDRATRREKRAAAGASRHAA